MGKTVTFETQTSRKTVVEGQLVSISVPITVHVVEVHRTFGNERREWTFVYNEDGHALTLDFYQVSKRNGRKARFFSVGWCSADGGRQGGPKYRDVEIPKDVAADAARAFMRRLIVTKKAPKR